jgi:hypothetical protein
MPARNMSAMQLSGIKRQFLRTSDIFATPRLAVRSLDDVRPLTSTFFFLKTPLGLTPSALESGWVFRQVFLHHPTAPFGSLVHQEPIHLS